MHILYSIFIQCYNLVLKLAAFWHPKAKLWVSGRINWKQKCRAIRPKDKQVIWMHCASVGEFEQGRPILAGLRQKYPQHFILLSFYSPSGYEARKKIDLADCVTYLPLDTKVNAKEWLEIWKPELTFFVKYEFWYNYLIELKKHKGTTLLIAGVFRQDQWFFRWYGRWAFPMLNGFDYFYLQDEASPHQLGKFGFNNYKVIGDPRVDRVLAISTASKTFPLIEQFKQDKPALIIGSSWPADELNYISGVKLLIKEGWKIIIAPHEIHVSQIEDLEKRIQVNSIRYSELNQDSDFNITVLIIDNIGMLSSLYRYGDLAYVGGGFGKSIHNLLEPAAHSIGVIFGPKHDKFMEARGLIDAGGGYAVKNQEEFTILCKQFLAVKERKRAGISAKNYLQSQKGATDFILNSLVLKNFEPSN